MTASQIAKELGCSEDQVKWAMKSALAKLRDGRARVFRDLVEELERIHDQEKYVLSVSENKKD
jgi:hypothetical protein